MAAHRQLACRLPVDAAERAQHLQLFIAQGIGIKRRRRFHRNKAQKLQHVVLHHVAQRAGLVVIAGTAFEPDRLGHGDLHMVDMRIVPKRLVKRVGKAQRHQVLDGLLAQIMVDAEDLAFLEHAADRVVEQLGRFQIAPDRLFDHDAGLFGDQTMSRDLLCDFAEQSRRNGEVENADHIVFADHAFQLIEAFAGQGVGRDIRQASEKGLQRFVGQLVGRHMLPQRAFGIGTVFLIGHLGARRTDDAARIKELPGHLALKQRRQELALG